MSLAIDAYISRVNGCPCGTTQIHLYQGPDTKEKQRDREKLLVFLKGSKKNKEALKRKRNEPSLYSHFDTVWRVR